MNPLAARARALPCIDPDTHYVLELIARSADVGWIRPDDLPELLGSLLHQHDWRSDEIGFEPRDDRTLVSFLDETVSCPAAALLDGLAQLIAAQERPCGALLLGHVERRPGLGWVVGGADAGLPGWTTEAIRALVGGHAILEGPMPAAISILDVSVHAALTGQRNVFLLLPEAATGSWAVAGPGGAGGTCGARGPARIGLTADAPGPGGGPLWGNRRELITTAPAGATGLGTTTTNA